VGHQGTSTPPGRCRGWRLRRPPHPAHSTPTRRPPRHLRRRVDVVLLHVAAGHHGHHAPCQNTASATCTRTHATKAKAMPPPCEGLGRTPGPPSSARAAHPITRLQARGLTGWPLTVMSPVISPTVLRPAITSMSVVLPAPRTMTGWSAHAHAHATSPTRAEGRPAPAHAPFPICTVSPPLRFPSPPPRCRP
jgi:hypothetical protein